MTDALIIDRGSASVPLDAAAVHAWAATQRVFLSSTMGDLAEHRRAVAAAVREIGARPVWFEEFGGRDQDPEQAYMYEVDSCDIYVGILGTRYGRQLPTGFSATHAEYLRAVERGLRISMWVLDVVDREGHQQSFLDEVQTFYVTEMVRDAGELAQRVRDRLVSMASEDAAPWVKFGRLVFRATHIEDAAEQVAATAVVKDGAVAHALREVSPTWPGARHPVRFTYGDRTRELVVDDVSVVTHAGSSQTFTLQLVTPRGSWGTGTNMPMAFSNPTGTYSADDLTELALRQALFGEDPGVGQSAALLDVRDPVAPLRAGAISEEVLRPLLRLMLVETLVATGKASRVLAVRLGAPTPRGRRLAVRWQTPTHYDNQQPQVRTVDGILDL